ncbi:MAG: glutamine synthetase III [Bacillota bacterium]
MKNLPEIFGAYVFNDAVMKKTLPKEIYKALKDTIKEGKHLELDVANSVAVAMKNWAIELGATHYTHWFQPMTGTTAEKHDSFIAPDDNGNVLMEFSGKELVQGEPDASSFPSGGLRATCEARGYTAWDPTSYAFVKDGSLYIPTAFCSFTGEALDKKTPLLRSTQAVSKEALKILRMFGDTETQFVKTFVGAEQEYFLVDKDVYNKRRDLQYCGRTLFGGMPAKGQELDDHYFGSIKPRVAAFMKDLDEELWKLGVPSKTKHNEVAPAQHEMAPYFEHVNIGVDHNHITMDVMKSVALKHNLVCMLAEKPFDGINGSGKHVNLSIGTDKLNLFSPNIDPDLFTLFLVAAIKAVDDYQDLLRITAASAGNDHRLGANEAPPAIISMYLGAELNAMLASIEAGTEITKAEKEAFELGAEVLPHFYKDTTDRNRTSPFAFTGNKFEFRMLGSSASIAGSCTVFCAAIAKVLNEFATALEGSKDFKADARALVKDTYLAHKRIIFNGDGYSDEWVVEAEKRGLLNLKTTPAALGTMLAEKNVEMFSEMGVYSKTELESRFEILSENYYKQIGIEAKTILGMVNKSILPSAFAYQSELLKLVSMKESASLDASVEKSLIRKISDAAAKTLELTQKLQSEYAVKYDDAYEYACYAADVICVTMDAMRAPIDELESLIGAKYWALPTYSDLILSV